MRRWSAGRRERDADAVERALEDLRAAAADEKQNIMPATIAAAKAGATTGEWAQALRDAFGDYRGPTGVGARRLGRVRGAPRRDPHAGRRGLRAARPPNPDPGRQARPRRPLERRRADRRARPRRRHGGHLPGHPPDPGADRGLRGRRGRGCRRALDPLRLAPGADPRHRAHAPRAGRGRAGRRSAGSSPQPTGRSWRRRAWRGSTRRRTSRSTGSWARSSSSWQSAAEAPPLQLEPAADRVPRRGADRRLRPPPPSRRRGRSADRRSLPRRGDRPLHDRSRRRTSRTTRPSGCSAASPGSRAGTDVHAVIADRRRLGHPRDDQPARDQPGREPLRRRLPDRTLGASQRRRCRARCA